MWELEQELEREQEQERERELERELEQERELERELMWEWLLCPIHGLPALLLALWPFSCKLRSKLSMRAWRDFKRRVRDRKV